MIPPGRMCFVAQHQELVLHDPEWFGTAIRTFSFAIMKSAIETPPDSLPVGEMWPVGSL
jgi:hypothetical protein